MKIQTLKLSAAALLPSVATMLFVQACGGSGDADAQERADPIEGVWEAVVTFRDCSTLAPTSVPPFRSVQAFHRGGTFTDSSSHSPVARSPGHGDWTRDGDAYTVKLRFYRYNPDGSFSGTSRSCLWYSIASRV